MILCLQTRNKYLVGQSGVLPKVLSRNTSIAYLKTKAGGIIVIKAIKIGTNGTSNIAKTKLLKTENLRGI